MAVDGEGQARAIAFRTQVDDLVEVGPEHPIRFEREAAGDGLKPYVHVRRNLWARLTRALTYDLLALGEVREAGGVPASAADRLVSPPRSTPARKGSAPWWWKTPSTG